MIKRAATLLRNLPVYVRVFGWRGLLCFARIRYSSSESPARMYFRRNRHPVYIRPKSSDVLTTREIFLDRDYDFPVEGRVEVIVDAGANIGLASVFFANAYPSARIIAIEPEKENFVILKRNIEPYPQVTAVNAALWSDSGQVRLIDPGRGEHGFITVQGHATDATHGEWIRSISMADLMKDCGIERIDVLKMDIEGAEKEVFASADGWIRHVGVIVAELHERLKPGCVEAFEGATRDMSTVLARGKLVVKAAH